MLVPGDACAARPGVRQCLPPTPCLRQSVHVSEGPGDGRERGTRPIPLIPRINSLSSGNQPGMRGPGPPPSVRPSTVEDAVGKAPLRPAITGIWSQRICRIWSPRSHRLIWKGEILHYSGGHNRP